MKLVSFCAFSLWCFVVWVGPCLMEDEEWQNALKPWKEKIGGLDCKARRRTLIWAVALVRPRKFRFFSRSKGVKSGEVDFSTWWLRALAFIKYDDLWESEKKRVLCQKCFGSHKTAPVDDLIQLLRTEGSLYHQKKFRLKANNTHANVVTACEERFATQMTAQTTALRDHLMLSHYKYRPRQQVTWPQVWLYREPMLPSFPSPKTSKKMVWW